MISLIQLKQVVRNKRFLMFTVLIPVAWYAFIANVQEGVTPNIVLGIAVFIGIIGNGLATFSKRISSNVGFYRFQARFSHYSMKKFMLDQSLVQFLLNSLIFFVVTVFAILFFHFPLTMTLVGQFLLLSVMGIYFSLIGFVLGVRVDAKTIDTVSFPAIMVAALTIVPFYSFGASGTFVNLISKIQMLFPGAYYTNIVNALYTNQAVELKDIALFILVFLLNALVLSFFLPRKK